MNYKLFIIFSLFIFLSSSVFSQQNTAIISGSINLNTEQYPNYKPYKIKLEKLWPIDSIRNQYIEIDTNTMSFHKKISINEFSEYKVTFISKNEDQNPIYNLIYYHKGIFEDSSKFNSKYINLNKGKYIINKHSIILEPDDSLHMDINYNSDIKLYGHKVNYSGNCGFNNNYVGFDIMINTFSDNSFKLPLNKGLKFEDQRLLEHKRILQLIKDSLSQNTYRKLYYDIIFRNLCKKHTLIRAELYNKNPNLIKNRIKARELYTFMDTLELKDEYLISEEYRTFLHLYLEYINRIVTGLDSPESSIKNLDLAKSIFKKDVLKYYWHNNLKSNLSNSKQFKKGKTEFDDFKEQFPNSPEEADLQKIIEQHDPIFTENLAPNLLLKDSLGNSIDLKDLKGKVVLVLNSHPWSQSKTFERLESINSLYQKKDLVVICTNTKPFGVVNKNYKIFDYIASEEKFNTNREAFNFKNSTIFLISKEGALKYYSTSLKKIGKKIPELIKEKYNLFNRSKAFFKSQKDFLLIILFVLTCVLFILLILRIVKTQTLKRKQKQLSTELKAIRAQLNPHFIFNSLNSLQKYINTSEIENANLHLSKFARLMRNVLEYSEKETITLDQEIKFIKDYIEIESVRYGFAHHLNIDAKIDVYNTEIPGLISQPFIENAIIHGLSGKEEKGVLEIDIIKKNHKICFTISDNGNGIETKNKNGFGLKSSMDRIDLINSQHNDKIELHIESNPQKFTKIQICIPELL